MSQRQTVLFFGFCDSCGRILCKDGKSYIRMSRGKNTAFVLPSFVLQEASDIAAMSTSSDGTSLSFKKFEKVWRQLQMSTTASNCAQ
jgi:hypothetical protein